jgi:hypothetical protein
MPCKIVGKEVDAQCCALPRLNPGPTRAKIRTPHGPKSTQIQLDTTYPAKIVGGWCRIPLSVVVTREIGYDKIFKIAEEPCTSSNEAMRNLTTA